MTYYEQGFIKRAEELGYDGLALLKLADGDMFGRPLPVGSTAIPVIAALRWRDRVGTSESRSGRSSWFGRSSKKTTSTAATPPVAPPAAPPASTPPAATPPDTPTAETPPVVSPPAKTPPAATSSSGNDSGVVDGIKQTTSAIRSFAGLLRTLNGD